MVWLHISVMLSQHMDKMHVLTKLELFNTNVPSNSYDLVAL